MPNVISKHRTPWLLGSLAALIVCAAIGVALTFALARDADLQRARSRWDARPFSRYHLITEHDGGLATCRQDVEIDRDRVVAVFANTCAREPITVANLFIDIERCNLTISGQCGPNGCACDGPIAVDARFDAALGYPTLFEVRSQAERRWQYLEYWRRLLTGGCTLVGFSGPSITVVALTPLP